MLLWTQTHHMLCVWVCVSANSHTSLFILPLLRQCKNNNKPTTTPTTHMAGGGGFSPLKPGIVEHWHAKHTATHTSVGLMCFQYQFRGPNKQQLRCAAISNFSGKPKIRKNFQKNETSIYNPNNFGLARRILEFRGFRRAYTVSTVRDSCLALYILWRDKEFLSLSVSALFLRAFNCARSHASSTLTSWFLLIRCHSVMLGLIYTEFFFCLLGDQLYQKTNRHTYVNHLKPMLRLKCRKSCTTAVMSVSKPSARNTHTHTHSMQIKLKITTQSLMPKMQFYAMANRSTHCSNSILHSIRPPTLKQVTFRCRSDINSNVLARIELWKEFSAPAVINIHVVHKLKWFYA